MCSFWACKEKCAADTCCFNPETDRVHISVESLSLDSAEEKQNDALTPQKTLPSLLTKSSCANEDLKLKSQSSAAARVDASRISDPGSRADRGAVGSTQIPVELPRAMPSKAFAVDEEERCRQEDKFRAEVAAAEARQHAQEAAEVARQKAAEQAERVRREAEEEASFRERLEKKREERRRASEDQAKVEEFLRKHKFSHVNEKQSKMMRKFFPLHVACASGDCEMVQLLLAAGANRNVKNSSGKTPYDVARLANKHGSHDQVLLVISEPASAKDAMASNK